MPASRPCATRVYLTSTIEIVEDSYCFASCANHEWPVNIQLYVISLGCRRMDRGAQQRPVSRQGPTLSFDDAFLTPLNLCVESGLPYVKGVYEPTGSGKTYSSARLVVDAFTASNPTIPIYIAPIKRLVDDFAQAIETVLKERGGVDIQVYRLYARADFENDDSVLNEAIPFCEEAKKHLHTVDSLNDPFAGSGGTDDAGGYNKKRSPSEWITLTENAVDQYRRCRDWARVSPLDPTLAEQMAEAMGRVWSGMYALCSEIVRREVLSDYRQGLFKSKALRPVLLKLMPLNLFAHEPGIIIATASKFASQAREVRQKISKTGKASAVFQTYDSFFTWASERQERFLLLIDEEEEAYAFLLRSLKKDLTNRDVDLHRVVYAFFHHFDLGSLANYADAEGEGFARRLFDITGDVVAQVEEIHRALEGVRSIDEKIDRLREIPCLAGFETAQLRILVRDFFGKNDIQNNFAKLKQKLQILEAIKRFIKEVHRPWPDREKSETPFDVYRRLKRVFQDKKQILAGRRTIKDLSNDLEYLFFNERLEVYDHEVLERVRVIPSIAHRNLELVTIDELADESLSREEESFSLGEFLRFVMLMTRILLKTPIEIPAESKSLRITDNQSSVLHRYKRKIGNWGIKQEDLSDDTSSADDPSLNPELVFQHSKFALSIVEDTGRRDEYSDDLRVMAIAATVLKRTPEELLTTFLRTNAVSAGSGSTQGNLVYLMSATGGMGGCWGSYNLRYLGQQVGQVGAEILGPTKSEMEFMEAFREYRASCRDVTVTDFDPDNHIARIEPGSLYRPLEREMLQELQLPDAKGYVERNPHKLNEIRHLAALLSRLACGNDRSAIAFTQTVGKFKDTLNRLAMRGMGVEVDKEIRGLYTFDSGAFGVPGEPIRIITYTANFGKEAARVIEGEVRPLTEADGIDEEADESVLSALLDERNQKILFVSSFRSASRGLNLVLKSNPQNGSLADRQGAVGRKDFDILMVAMSPHYDGLYRVPDETLIHMEKLQAMLQHLYLKNTLYAYKYRDLPQVIADGREEAFRPEYFRKIGREMIQTIGRVERVEGAPTSQHLFLNQEVVTELAQFFKLEPDFKARLSAGNYAVFRHVKAFMQRTRMFQAESEWDDYVRDEVIRGDAFLRTSASIYRGFRNSAKRTAWERIRNPLMFTDPLAYVKSLESCPDGLDPRGWKAFVDYAFVPRARKDLYLVGAGKAVSAIRNAEDAHGEVVVEAATGKLAGLPLISDLHHAEGGRFDPAARLVPAELRSTPEFVAAIKKAAINMDALFTEWVPRPQFFMDYAKGYFAELIFTNLIAEHPTVQTIDAASHPKAAEIFERFDSFIEGPNRILAIDLKNWGRRADRLIGRRLREAAPGKTRIVEAALQVPIVAQRKAIVGARIVERALGDKPVLPIYLNLCGPRSGGQETLDGRVVRFFNLFIAEDDGEGWTRYVLNSDFMALIDSTCWKPANV